MDTDTVIMYSITMNAVTAQELQDLAEADLHAQPSQPELRIEWHHTYGCILIEVRGGVAYVNGEPVEVLKASV